MKRSLALSLSVALVVAASFGSAQADDLNLDLQYTASGWEVYAEIIDNAGPNSGDNGLAAVRLLIDNISFGAGGADVTINGGGAINPIDQGGANERLPVLQTAGGTLDIIYGQDISDAGSVVGGVGVGSTLIASGSWSGGTAPAWGDDDQGKTTDANFLAVAAPGTQTAAYAPDNIILEVTDLTGGTGTPGDYDASGAVGQGDLDLVLLNWGSTAPPVPAGWVNEQPSGLIGQSDLDGVLLNWGNTAAAGAATAAVPEPTSIALAGLALVGLASTRRVRS